jgi:hypothetical protein
MQSINVGIWGAVELAKSDRQVAVANTLVDLQRELVEYLEHAGGDVVSAKIVFDSLLLSLALSVNHRHRLRRTLSEQVAAA